MCGTLCMVTSRFSHVKFKKLPCELLFLQDEMCHFPKTTHGICSKRVITQDVAVEVSVQPMTEVTYVWYRPTTTSHMCYTMRMKHTYFSMEREIIMQVPLNLQGFAKPQVIATQTGFTCVP